MACRASAGVGALHVGEERRRVTADAQRTVRQVTLVVETVGLSAAEHERRVRWAESNLLSANGNVAGAYVAVIVTDEEGSEVRHSGSGTPTDDTRALIEELRAS
jgi:hypothetical protein